MMWTERDRVQHLFDKTRGQVLAVDPSIDMVYVKFQDGKEDWCNADDLQSPSRLGRPPKKTKTK